MDSAQKSSQSPPAYGAIVGQQTSVVIGQPQTVFVRNIYGEIPVRMVCPNCRQDILTATRYEPGTLTWVAAGVICIFGLWLGCCLIPFCLDPCKDVIHSCPACQHVIGKYNRM